MAKFHFRLQRVMEYRAILEEQAKDAYIDAKAAKLEAEAVLKSIDDHRKRMLISEIVTVQDRLALDATMSGLDDQERQQKIIVQMLELDEESRRVEWVSKKQELEALVRLHDKEFEAWQLEETRKEQAELDEWAVTRKSA